jgi:hypothetical protein
MDGETAGEPVAGLVGVVVVAGEGTGVRVRGAGAGEGGITGTGGEGQLIGWAATGGLGISVPPSPFEN